MMVVIPKSGRTLFMEGKNLLTYIVGAFETEKDIAI